MDLMDVFTTAIKMCIRISLYIKKLKKIYTLKDIPKY